MSIPAEDMVKAWPSITSELTADDLKQFDRTLDRTLTKKTILTTLKWARLLGLPVHWFASMATRTCLTSRWTLTLSRLAASAD